MILLLLLSLTALSALEQLHKQFAVFNDLENEIKWKALHRTHEDANESALLKENFNFAPKSILKNSQVDDMKKIPSLKRVSFADKIDVRRIRRKKKCKKVVQTEVQEESDIASTLGPGKAPEPANIVPPKER
jgi:hypothetical protein